MIRKILRHAILLILCVICICTVAATPPPLAADTHSPLANIRTPKFDHISMDHYAGQGPVSPISLNFTNVKVRELLQIIAQFTKLNFVINDNVKGEMSIHLHQVPWTQALDVILKSQNLGERRVGNVVYVAPLQELMKQQITELEDSQKMRDLVPLTDQVIRLNYADAADVQKILDTKNFSLLSSRGTTNIDARTNSVWIRDTPERVAAIVKLLHELDYPVKQVMIEARIVSVNEGFERQLGARFGLTDPTHLSGTLSGANTMVADSATTESTIADVPLAHRLNFDMAATGTMFGSTNQAGSIGIAVAKLGSAFIDMELSALEEENDLDIISSPRLITSNQKKAYIETGEQIPYQSSSSSGSTSVSYVDAELKLEVTPQITPDNRVILNLTVTNNSAGSPISLQVPGGAPGAGSAIPINTEEEQSSVLLNNNQTVVLGGVYQREKSNVIKRIPFLYKIPLVGHLFTNSDRLTQKDELLIFLTPHIISRPSEIASS